MEQRRKYLLILRWLFAESEKESDIFADVDWLGAYNFFNEHTITPVANDLIPFIPDEYADLKKTWKDSVYSNVFKYARFVKSQEQILEAFRKNKIPVAVLKGTSAAKYYPKPQLRAMGDIDLLVKPDDYNRAVECLKSNGCSETTVSAENERGRHRSFSYGDSSIELHYFFSSQEDSDKAQALDNLLFASISDCNTVLPDEENGLVLLAHIRQHLRGGLGIRQIIDWMMFVKAYLNDEKWYSSFRKKAQDTGLEQLATAVTKMCQNYLGLKTENITWCKDVDENICDKLLQYILESGNFGRSRELTNSAVVGEIPKLYEPVKLFKYIQAHGKRNWAVLKKHPRLKPFAWIYQLCRYIKMAVQNRIGAGSLKEIYDEGNKRNDMFAELGL